MATKTKSEDAALAALAAIEEALEIPAADPDNRAGQGSGKSSQAKGLPQADALDIFRDEMETGDAPPLPSEAGEAEMLALGRAGGARMGGAYAKGTEAAAMPRLTLQDALPANDDYRVSVAEMLEPLEQPPGLLPYLAAAVFSLLWLGGAIYLLVPGGEGAAFAPSSGSMIMAVLGALFPVLFLFALAMLYRRMQQMQRAAQVMAQVAARLGEPETLGAERVMTLGQAVRREVSSIGDGIERAVARASELESVVHGEVTALERSYAENEYKMRSLVNELAAEREAIMATADRIRATVEGAQSSFSTDIEQATGAITGVIDEVGLRIRGSFSERQEDLVRALEGAAQQISTLIEEKGEAFNGQLMGAADHTQTLLGKVRGELIATLQQTGGEVTTRIAEEANALRQATEMSVQQTTTALTLSLETATNQLREASEATRAGLEGGVSEATQTFRQYGNVLQSEIADTLALASASLEENGRTLVETLTEQSVEVNRVLRESTSDVLGVLQARGLDASQMLEERGAEVVELITSRGAMLTEKLIEEAVNLERGVGESARLIDSSLAGHTARIVSVLDTRTGAMNDGLAKATGSLEDVLERRADLVERMVQGTTTRLDTMLGQYDSRLGDYDARISQHLDAATGALARTLKDQTEWFEASLIEGGQALADLMARRVAEAQSALNLASDTMADQLGERARQASFGLNAEIDGFVATLRDQAGSATEGFARAGQNIVQAITAQGARVHEALANNANSLADTVTKRTAGLAERFEHFEQVFVGKADRLEDTVITRSEQINEVLQQRTEAVNTVLDGLLERIESGIDERAKSLGDLMTLKTLDLARVLNEDAQTLAAGMDQQMDAYVRRVSGFSQEVVEPLTSHIRALDATTAGLTELVDTRALRVIEGIDAASEDLGRRAQANIEALMALVDTKVTQSVTHLGGAGDTLRKEVNDVLSRLGDANQLLASIVAGTSGTLTDLEGRLAERVRVLESTLGSILDAARQGTDVLGEKLTSLRTTSADIGLHSQRLAGDVDRQTDTLRHAAVDLVAMQDAFNRSLGEREHALQSLTHILQERAGEVDTMLRSFTSLMDAQLNEAQSRARETGSLLYESTEAATEAINSHYARVRDETARERERTALALRSTYEQSRAESVDLFQRQVGEFSNVAGQFREAAQAVLSELAEARDALSRSTRDLPREARDASLQVNRLIQEQAGALEELNRLAGRLGAGADVAQAWPAPSARLPEPALAAAPVAASAAASPAWRAGAGPSAGGGKGNMPAGNPNGQANSWLSGLLERASEEPGPRDNSRNSAGRGSAQRIESLDSLSVDIARMIDHNAAIDLWDRYRNGERNVFTRRLYTLQGQQTYDDIRRRYGSDREFRRTVDAYLEQFERLLADVAGDDRDSMMARTYLTSDTGKVYTMLAHAAGKLG